MRGKRKGIKRLTMYTHAKEKPNQGWSASPIKRVPQAYHTLCSCQGKTKPRLVCIAHQEGSASTEYARAKRGGENMYVGETWGGKGREKKCDIKCTVLEIIDLKHFSKG